MLFHSSQESKATNIVEKDLDDEEPAHQDSPSTASELDDGEQSTPKNLESTPENLLEGKASKVELIPNSKFLQKKLKVINFARSRKQHQYCISTTINTMACSKFPYSSPVIAPCVFE